VACNGSRARAVGPEGLARLGRDGHKALACPPIGKANDLGGRTGHRLVIVTHDVANEHHLGQAAAFALGRVANSAKVSLIEVLKSCKPCATGLGIQEVFDLNNRGHGLLGIAKEL